MNAFAHPAARSVSMNADAWRAGADGLRGGPTACVALSVGQPRARGVIFLVTL